MQRYVVMGVSGCGKTSVGTGFARAIGAQFIDGDDLHPPENVAKMSRGEPLDDSDRGPWLAAVAAALGRARSGVVIGCSALRRRYRDLIRDGAGGDVVFLHLSGSRDLIAGRMGAREGHFMPLTLLDSQFAALEPPGPGETCVTVDIDQTEEQVVRYLIAQTQHLRAAGLA